MKRPACWVAIIACSIISGSNYALASTIWSGTNYDIVVSNPISVGSSSTLLSTTLTIVGKNGALPNTFDSTKSGSPGPNPGISSSTPLFHQVWIDGIFSDTPSPLLDALNPSPSDQALDTHFMFFAGDLATATAPAENRVFMPSLEQPFVTPGLETGFGNSLTGSFAVMGAASPALDLVQIVVPIGTEVSLDFEVGAPDFSSESVQTSFIVIPEPSTIVLGVCGFLCLGGFLARRSL